MGFGLGNARWVLDDEDRWGNPLWLPALGIWAVDGRFFVVLVPKSVQILELVRKIAADEVLDLPYPFRMTDRPKPGEFESLWGKCPPLGIDRQPPTR